MPKFSFLNNLHCNLSKRKLLMTPDVYLLNVEELKQVFDKFDSNKDGKISPDEYKAILRAIGKRSAISTEVEKIFEVADVDGDGFIDFNEFTEVQKMGGGVKSMDLQGAFQAFDANNDGKITVEDIYQLLRKLGERCSVQDCKKMVRAVDANGDGVIDSDEFFKMMTRTMIKN